MESIEQMVNSVVTHLGGTATSGAVAGEPIKVGDVTLVVLSMLSVGMGAGGGESKGDGKATPRTDRRSAPGAGGGEGAGGAVKVRPAAVIVFTPEGVEVLPIPAPPDVFDKVVERVPDVIDLVEKARHVMS